MKYQSSYSNAAESIREKYVTSQAPKLFMFGAEFSVLFFLVKTKWLLEQDNV